MKESELKKKNSYIVLSAMHIKYHYFTLLVQLCKIL